MITTHSFTSTRLRHSNTPVVLRSKAALAVGTMAIVMFASFAGATNVDAQTSAASPNAAGPLTKPTLPFYQCPVTGNDTSCGTLIVINTDNSVSVYSDVTQGPYDGSDDTLIGVLNNSATSVLAIPLKSSLPIFAFDGDGICTSTGAPPSSSGSASSGGSIPCGTTGYEGPGVTLSSSDSSAGSVGFGATGLQPGKTAYFGLEAALTRFDVLAPQTLAPTPLPPPDANQPGEPCERLAVEKTANGGVTLFGISGQAKGSVEESTQSDGLYDVTGRTELGGGVESIEGIDVQAGKSVTLSADIDSALHINWADEKRSYWFNNGDADSAVTVANNWLGETASDKNLWTSREDWRGSALGVDVSGYESFGAEAGGAGVSVNSGDSGALWLQWGTNPLTGDTSVVGVLDLTMMQGLNVGPIAGAVNGDVVVTLTYTEDKARHPKSFEMKLEAGTSGSIGLAADGSDLWDTFLGDEGGASLDVGVVIEMGVTLDLTQKANLKLSGNYMASTSSPTGYVQASDTVIRSSMMKVLVYLDTGSSDDVGLSGGLGGILSFKVAYGTETHNKTLVKAGYASNGLAIHEWAECESGKTPFDAANE
jgi:hypothetical protein